ncbi:UDP-N-acetylmuramoyl-tripeptide--D-alanyl-D-alanine ligase [Thalassobacillus hwangdonensis]|uniref:UDP-N-acetylmuramoyl-tripeptide--D-alanyl-D-alanine ligase n=1 Tax=Thalassobacillus hwangdonensis TaxID=546108 RepID=A0ABW3KXW2_9BACI
MLFTINELNQLFTEARGEHKDSIPVKSIMTDSRRVHDQSLFVPIVGENFDAHDFLKKAIENGAIGALWQKDKKVPAYVPTDFPLFLVEDTTLGLQQMAGFYLQKVSPKVVAVTGSNGKTTTKDLVASVLSTTYKTHKTEGNHNNHIGLPLTLFAMPEETEVVVLEMGMSSFGEIETLSNLARPDFAIITNIGESHIEYLGSREGIAKAKLEIKAGLRGPLIFDGDEALLSEEHDVSENWPCGFGEENRNVIKDMELSDQSSSFTIDGRAYQLPLAGAHNVLNASFAITAAKLMGVSEEAIQQGLDQSKVTGMRFERVEGKNGSLIINDTYNASPTSMKAVIEVIKQMKEKTRKVLVLGDIYELGEFSKDLHRKVADAVNDEIDAIYTFGNDADEITKAVLHQNPSIQATHYTDKQTLADKLTDELRDDTVILLKASRGVRLETLLETLTES